MFSYLSQFSATKFIQIDRLLDRQTDTLLIPIWGHSRKSDISVTLYKKIKQIPNICNIWLIMCNMSCLIQTSSYEWWEKEGEKGGETGQVGDDDDTVPDEKTTWEADDWGKEEVSRAERGGSSMESREVSWGRLCHLIGSLCARAAKSNWDLKHTNITSNDLSLCSHKICDCTMMNWWLSCQWFLGEVPSQLHPKLRIKQVYKKNDCLNL